MIRRAAHPVYKSFAYDSTTNISNCLIEGCSFPRTTGKNSGNLIKHVKRKHAERIGQLEEEIVQHLATKHSHTIRKVGDECAVIAKISKKEFMKGCMEFVVINGRPYAIFEDSGFLKIVEPITKAFKLSGRSVSFNRCVMEDNANAIRELVKNRIKSEMNGKLLSLKIDLTTHMNRCILGVNVQYYLQDTLVVRTLAMKRIFDGTTGVNLAIVLKQIMADYDVDVKRIYTITTDNGTNVMKCARIMPIFQGNQLEDYLDSDIETLDEATIISMVETEIQHTECGEELKFLFNVHCSAHTMQLCLHDVFGLKNGEWEKFLERCRNLVIELRTTKIHNIITRRNLPVPLLNSDVRWSSIHKMVSYIF